LINREKRKEERYATEKSAQPSITNDTLNKKCALKERNMGEKGRN